VFSQFLNIGNSWSLKTIHLIGSLVAPLFSHHGFPYNALFFHKIKTYLLSGYARFHDRNVEDHN
jgi:hypothetical protein